MARARNSLQVARRHAFASFQDLVLWGRQTQSAGPSLHPHWPLDRLLYRRFGGSFPRPTEAHLPHAGVLMSSCTVLLAARRTCSAGW